jgi:hypothetical protein
MKSPPSASDAGKSGQNLFEEDRHELFSARRGSAVRQLWGQRGSRGHFPSIPQTGYCIALRKILMYTQ